jgi:hypothetical protein
MAKINVVSPPWFLHALGRMAKQALGRNLGTLLQPRAPSGAGVRSLMQGPQPAAAAPRAQPLIPRWYLLGGDLLLSALAIIILYKSPHPLSWKKELFCAGILMVGGCLAVVALLQPDLSCAGTGVVPE